MRGKETVQRIGQVLHVSPNRNVILKAEKVPQIGDAVVDEKLKHVGTVFDVFGPVCSPYVAVKSSVGDPHRFVNRVLYALVRKPGRKEKWKRIRRKKFPSNR